MPVIMLRTHKTDIVHHLNDASAVFPLKRIKVIRYVFQDRCKLRHLAVLPLHDISPYGRMKRTVNDFTKNGYLSDRY